MFVPNYQMHNVLNVYSNKLRRSITSGENQNTPEKPPVERVTLTSDGKRRATIEKVSKEIFDKITRFGSRSEPHQRISEQVKRMPDKKSASAKAGKAGFIFNVIDTINQKKTNTVSVEDSKFLIQRLDQLAKDTQEKKRNHEFEDQEKLYNPAI